MTATSREAILTKLFAVLSATGSFVTIGRRNRDPESLNATETPALFMVEHSEDYDRKTSSLPAIRRITVKAIFYRDIGADLNAIPATDINNILDALDVALLPDDPMTNRCTLGGLVQSVQIDGTIEKAPGDVTGKSLAVVPLKIVWP